MVSRAEFALQPCGHVCLCGDCHWDGRCPVCRHPTTGKMRVFMPSAAPAVAELEEQLRIERRRLEALQSSTARAGDMLRSRTPGSHSVGPGIQEEEEVTS